MRGRKPRSSKRLPGRVFDEDDQHQRIGMALRECMVNAVVHGNRYNRNKKVHVRVIRSVETVYNPDYRSGRGDLK